MWYDHNKKRQFETNIFGKWLKNRLFLAWTLVKNSPRYGEFFNKVNFTNTAKYQGFLKMCVLKTAFYMWSNRISIKTIN